MPRLLENIEGSRRSRFSTGRDQLILACKVAWVCWESGVPPTGAACINNGRRDCRYIIMLYGAL